MTEQKVQHKEHFHGSDLEKIEAVYGIPKDKIISFSSNVNPLGISENLKEHLAANLDVITTYPDREYTSLRNSIAAYTGTRKEFIIPGNGTTELISLVFQVIQPGKSLILGPTYSEYEREIQLGGGSASYFVLPAEKDFALDTDSLLKELSNGYQLLVICNPNNPTSTCLAPEVMEKIVAFCHQNHIFVLVDETYIEFVENVDVSSAIRLCQTYPNLIVLRGTSKFFASPGLRLGYGITANETILNAIHLYVNPWSINSLAVTAGEFMFSDQEYIQATRTLMFQERERIVSELRTIPDLKVYEPTANFVLVKILTDRYDAQDLFEAAIRKGLMIRNCSTFHSLDQSFFRFCFLLPSQNDALLECIKSI